MRYYLLIGVAVLGGMAASPVSARYGYCTASHDRAVSFEPTGQHFPQILSGVLDFGEDNQNRVEAERQFGAFLRKNSAHCNGQYETLEDARRAKERRLEFSRGTDTDTGWTGSFAAAGVAKPTLLTSRGTNASQLTTASRQPEPPAKPAPSKPTTAPSKYVEVAGPNGPIRLSPEVAARNQAAADDYRRKMDEHARVMAAHDQTLAQHRQNAATAASAKEQHDREVAAAAERVAAHRLALAEHAKKVAGASTNEDPNRCITSPAIKPGLRGNTEAHVTNGCDQKVDIVICLKRTSGDWLCGARFGILSQRSMSFMSTNATGEIYVDAVTFGSSNKLGRPAGIIK